MPFPTSAAIMAGGNIAGTMISGSSSKAEARRARKQQLYLARNAHQIEVADLKAAGLNPILSAGGSGAHGSPVPQAQIPDYGAAFGRGVSSAIALKSARADASLKQVQQKAAGVQLGLQERMYRWLSENPAVGKMVYAGMAAKLAGLPATVFAPIAAAATSAAKVKTLFPSKTRQKYNPKTKEYEVPQMFLPGLLRSNKQRYGLPRD